MSIDDDAESQNPYNFLRVSESDSTEESNEIVEDIAEAENIINAVAIPSESVQRHSESINLTEVSGEPSTDIIMSKLFSIEKSLHETLDKHHAPSFEPIFEAISGLNDGIESLRQLFDARISRTEHEEKVIDNMHSELSRYRQDMYARLLRPILLDIADARDYAIGLVLEAQPAQGGKMAIDAGLVGMLADQLLESMAKNGVESYQSELMSSFDPAKMRIVKKIPTNDKTLHGKVARSVNDGYAYDGRRLMPERVWVYSFTQE
ncbi:MAG: nucleotide exchange factor GrpE [Clostridiales bacterium]|nr:nucleotide exchange factor GrpE [Clostridiales bacterium]